MEHRSNVGVSRRAVTGIASGGGVNLEKMQR
jgi:hypothetical protein